MAALVAGIAESVRRHLTCKRNVYMGQSLGNAPTVSRQVQSLLLCADIDNSLPLVWMSEYPIRAFNPQTCFAEPQEDALTQAHR